MGDNVLDHGGESPVRVEIWQSCTQVGNRAADLIQEVLLERPNPVFALPTGATPLAMYDELVRRRKAGILQFHLARFFNLDEFVGVQPGDEGSFYRYMKERFWGPAGLSEGQYDIPRGWAEDLEKECRRYEEAIAEAGGIDLALVGIGNNGHVAFNEPGSEPSLGTHVVELSEGTRRVQAVWFGGSVERVPRLGLTVGLRTILQAREIVLLACGPHKAKVVRAFLLDPPTPEVPASLLRLHGNLRVLLDNEAAALLSDGTPGLHLSRQPAP